MTREKLLLIVDDDPAIAKVVTLRLKKAGYETISAIDGESAIRTATERLPDAIVLDRQLGDDDGLSVLAALTRDERTRDIPILLISGEQPAAGDLIDAKVGAFLAKPFCGNELIEKINQLLDPRSASEISCGY
jgi:twitching motility two-component system response regulator PilH